MAGIVISSRVHPGESNASWLAHGILETLMSDNEQSRWLLSKYVFKARVPATGLSSAPYVSQILRAQIVPMLNPDGVINGFYRTSISGHDLNRCWIDPSPEEHSPIAALKALLKAGQAGAGVDLFCDLHGHVRASFCFVVRLLVNPWLDFWTICFVPA